MSKRPLIRERQFVPVPLSSLRAGQRAVLHATDLAPDQTEMLEAMGLDERCPIEVCKVGNPLIVKVRSTRLGLSGDIARHIQVRPESASA